MATPSCVNLLARYRDVVPLRRLKMIMGAIGMLPMVAKVDTNNRPVMVEEDPLIVVNEALQTKKPQYEVIGENVCFKPYTGLSIRDKGNTITPFLKQLKTFPFWSLHLYLHTLALPS